MRTLRIQILVLVALAVLAPLAPIVWTTRALIGRTIDPLFAGEVLEGLEAGMEIARGELEREKEALLLSVRAATARDTLDPATLDPRERAALAELARLAGRAGEASGEPLWIAPLRLPLGGRELLVAGTRGEGSEPVWLVRALPDSLVERTGRLAEGLRLVQALQRQRQTLLRGFFATALVAYGSVLVVLLAIGLWFATRITRPLTALGRGIDAVAAGDLTARVSRGSKGGIGRLLRHFDGMAERLEEQQAERIRLERLEAWRQMARRLAHEIKNPLTPIQLAAQQMRQQASRIDPGERAGIEEATAIIVEEVRRLRALLGDFAQFARLRRPILAPLALGDLLVEVAALYGPGRVRVVDRVGPESGTVHWDREQIHRVLVNLIDNALNAQERTGSGEPVEVAADAVPGGGIRISVRDRGPGVPAADRRRIFEPEFTTRREGMGLGLAIAEGAIGRHAGTITVGDRSGGGAEFVVSVPARPPAPEGEDG